LLPTPASSGIAAKRQADRSQFSTGSGRASGEGLGHMREPLRKDLLGTCWIGAAKAADGQPVADPLVAPRQVS